MPDKKKYVEEMVRVLKPGRRESSCKVPKAGVGKV
jgi:ubiquinone/menaquinone biosynthesis C-methylase UbiE